MLMSNLTNIQFFGCFCCYLEINDETFLFLWQGVPMLYVPLEVVMSKYYGESERLLAKVFSLANELPNGAIIFLDEVNFVAMILILWVLITHLSCYCF